MIVGYLKSNETVYKNGKFPLLKEEFKPHLIDALKKINSNNEEFICINIDMGKTVGENICVETTATDEIIYAQRVGLKRLSRFVKYRKPEPTTFITVILKKIDSNYLLLTAYPGKICPPEPGDQRATTDSIPFWETHALIFERFDIVEESKINF